MKLLVLGHGRHGKDTVCEMLNKNFGLTFQSSSLFAAEHVVMPYLAERGVTFPDVASCYEARGSYRKEWHEAIAEFNAENPARLGEMIFAQYDIYCGLRSMLEFSAMYQRGMFDAALWVFRPQLPLESRDSMKLTPNIADLHIHNDGSLEELEAQVKWAHEKLRRKLCVAIGGYVPAL